MMAEDMAEEIAYCNTSQKIKYMVIIRFVIVADCSG